MATATELERLMVRLVGEGSDYERVLDEAVAATEQATKQINALTETEMAAQNAAMEEAARITHAVATPTEQYAAELENLGRLYRAGHLGQEAYTRAVKEAQQTLPGVREAQARYAAELRRAKEITAAAATPTERYQQKLAEVERLYKRGMVSGRVYQRTVAGLNKEFQKGSYAIRAYGEKITAIGRSMRNVGMITTFAFTLPLLAAGGAMLKTAADAEQTRIKFETMLGADRGRALLSRLREFAAVTPFRFPGVSDAAKTLIAFGVEQEKVMGTMRMLGDVAAGTGKDYRELAVIFGQIRGMGRLGDW